MPWSLGQGGISGHAASATCHILTHVALRGRPWFLNMCGSLCTAPGHACKNKGSDAAADSPAIILNLGTGPFGKRLVHMPSNLRFRGSNCGSDPLYQILDSRAHPPPSSPTPLFPLGRLRLNLNASFQSVQTHLRAIAEPHRFHRPSTSFRNALWHAKEASLDCFCSDKRDLWKMSGLFVRVCVLEWGGSGGLFWPQQT